MIVAAVLSHDAVLDDDDLVGVAQRAEPMGDSDDGAAGDQPLQGFDHQVFGLGVQRRSRLVKNQNWVVADERAGDPDALALPARQRHTTVADDAVVAIGHAE